MPLVPKTYDRNLKSGKFYSTAVIGAKGYNPTVIEYYDAPISSGGNLVKIEHIWHGKRWSQDITCSGHGTPTYAVTYSAWEEDTTYSG